MAESADLSFLARSLRGPLNFLRRDAEEIGAVLPDAEQTLPIPQRVFLADDEASPVVGFPILHSRETQALSAALTEYLKAEELAQLARFGLKPHDHKPVTAAWERYQTLLATSTENVTTSSYGRHFADIFWLHHSFEVARLLKETPMRLLRHDLEVGKRHGATIKYKVFFRYLDRVLALTYDLVSRLAADTEEVEDELFPGLLTRMRDNVLVFTEDHISRDLSELSAYFQGYLDIDGNDLRFRLAKLHTWHSEGLRSDAELRAVASHLLHFSPDSDPRELLKRPGYLAYLATREDYDSRRLLQPEQVQVCESLLLKLKEFELIHGLRRLVIPLRFHEGELALRDRSLNRTWVGSLAMTRVSSSTRPLDFMAPWVVDPQVDRYGMVYDITDFSELISVLRRSGSGAQDRSFRRMFRFQRRVNRLASSHNLRLEKYLGDGAFYSSRAARRLVIVAILVQRYYIQALSEGFPFDRGMRIALNYGHYRLLPIQAGSAKGADRYEFFGHGVVELSRLATGKAARDVDEMKTMLISRGYSPQVVHDFFAPLADSNVDVVKRQEEERQFYAYLDANGSLINEGIVATRPFVAQLAREGGFDRLYRALDPLHNYVAAALPSTEGHLLVGVRKMGLARLKGLDPLPVYELRDGDCWKSDSLERLEATDLVEAADRELLVSTTEESLHG